MSKAIGEIVAGAALIALDIIAPYVGIELTTAWASAIAGSGASLVMGGIGTLLAQNFTGLSQSVRNPIQPWNAIYGQTRVGGTLVFIEENGDTDKYLHLVYVLACHPCQSLDAVLFDSKRVILSDNSTGDSFSPTQATQDIASITRTDNQVTVVLSSAIDGLEDGDYILIKNVSGDETLNGTWPISVVSSTSFTYVNGGSAVSITGSGQAETTWPDYSDHIHVEAALGTQTSNPFPGLTGTDGSNGLWTDEHVLQGRTAVYVRVRYSDKTFAGGLPNIGFVVSGKNDIYDPRTGTTGYTANAALCIADYLAQPVWGFRCAYGTDIPITSLIAAANICDEAVSLAGGLSTPTITTWLVVSGVATEQPTGSTTYSYVVVAKNGSTIVSISPVGTTNTASNVLSSTDYVAVTWNLTRGATSYDIYRTVGFVTGKIASGVTDIFFNDTGFVGDGTAPPTTSSGGTVEPRYTCNGTFQLSAKRGEILQNLLTSCGGRLTYSGGQFIIWPAAWYGSFAINTNLFLDSLVGAFTDGSGNVIEPIYIGNGATFTVPIGATQLQLGVNDDTFDDNGGSWVVSVDGTHYTVPGTTTPWLCTGGQNSNYTIGQESFTSPVVVPVTAGSSTTISYVSGTVTDAAGTDCDGNGNTNISYHDVGFLGLPVPASYMGISSTSGTPNSITGVTHFAGAFQWKPKVSSRDLFNGVKATYVSPANAWQATDMPPYAQDTDHGYASDANLAADGGERRWYEMQLPFTTSVSMAQRLAKIELLRRRQQGTGTFIFNLSMLSVTAMDVLSFTLPPLGWTDKLLEVTHHRFTVNEQKGEKESAGIVLGTEIDVQETDPSIYDWSSSEELSAQGVGPSAPNRTVSAPTGATATSGTGVASVGSNGVSQSRVQVSWTAPTDGYVLNGGYTVVQYQVTGSSTWTALGNYDPTTTSAYIDGVSDGTSYTTRVAFMSAQGIQSDWTVLAPVTASGSSLNLHIIDDEIPTGTMDGVNATFTLANAPVIDTNGNPGLALYYNGAKLIPTVQYTLSGSTITIVASAAIPDTSKNDSLRASYRY